MSTKKEILAQGIIDGNLTEDQLTKLTIPQIESYAEQHGYAYKKDVLKDELIQTVLDNVLLPGDTAEAEFDKSGELPEAPKTDTVMFSKDVVGRVGPTAFEIARRTFATISGEYQNWNLTRSQIKAKELLEQIDVLSSCLKELKLEIKK